MTDGRLREKVCVITGAGRGIGAAIARAFVAEGAAAVMVDLDGQSVIELADRLQGEGGRAIAFQADVGDAAAFGTAVDGALERFGRVDVLVNNAGINMFRDPLMLTDADWRRCFEVDLNGAWNGCRSILPHMIATGRGSIVNIASVHSFKIIPGCFPYPVAKHALIGLTRALAIEYAAKGIRVNAIAPGYIETQLNVDYWNSMADPAAARRASYDLHPPKRIGRPEEVAMTAVFLASDEAPFINAETIVIDGGRSALYHD